MVVIDVSNKNAFEAAVNSGHLVVAHFYADWTAQCGPMNDVLDELSKQANLHNVKFIKVPAEEVPEVSLQYDITGVPTVLLIRSAKCVDRVNGANAAEVTKKVNQHSSTSFIPPVLSATSVPSATPVASSAPVPSAVPPAEDLNAEIQKLINQAPIVLFMKGSANEPKCGFSKTMIEILKSHNAQYKTYDILSNDDIRQGLKKFSNWPTYPQLYVNGEFIGGLDIAKEMNDSGELGTALGVAQSLEARLKALINKSPCMVFMKGNREAPKCGFSRQLMEILTEAGIPFETFDILGNEEVRQGLKTYSDWPTYPQVYVKGELIGGLDIIKEMKAAGELLAALKGES